MYYQLLDWDPSHIEEDDLPQAHDPAFCNQLVEGEVQSTTPRDIFFSMGEACLALDYLPLREVRLAKLCSQRFLDVLTSASVPYTATPVSLLHRETQRPLEARYAFWLPQSIDYALDWERSEAWTSTETGMRRFIKIVLAAEVEVASPLLFHAQGTGRFFVHETLCRHLQAAEVTGIAFASLEMAFSPYADVKKQKLEQWLHQHPDDWESWGRLSDLLVVVHHEKEAAEPLEQALQLQPDADRLWYKRGRLLYHKGELIEAQRAFQQAMTLNPQSVAYGEYCTLLRTRGAKEEALACAQAWVHTWGKSPLPWYELAMALGDLAREEEALQAVEQGLARGGGAKLNDFFLAKVNLLLRLGRYEEALIICVMRSRATPWKRPLWEGKISALVALGRQEEAKEAQQELARWEQHREDNLKRRPF